MSLVEVDDFQAAQRWFLERGLTDGLPVIPPTEDLVAAMIAGAARARSDALGHITGRPENPVSVEQAAVCAVMAGASPHYFPVILATWEAVLDPALNGATSIGSSAGTAITAVVSGPHAADIGMNGARNLFGPGNHANASIGRSIRLGVMNALGYRPSRMDGSAFGTQARYTAHFAERVPEAPWLPLNVRLGYPAQSTTVTVAMTDAPRQVHYIGGNPDELLAIVATAMKDLSHHQAGQGSSYFVVLGPEHDEILRTAGWRQDAIRKHLVRATRTTPDELARSGRPIAETGWPVRIDKSHANFDDEGMLPMAVLDDLILLTGGGNGSGWSHIIFAYGASPVVRPITKEVVVP